VSRCVREPDSPTRPAWKAASGLPDAALVVLTIRFPLVARGKHSLRGRVVGDEINALVANRPKGSAGSQGCRA
jgi:hypothetical protein